jgi:hypothetical protein
VAWVGTLLWSSAALLISRPAQAREEYAGEVQALLGMDCPPPCTTCHLQPTGGKNWNSFGIQFRTPLIMGKSWADLLAQQRQLNVDTDLDGRGDVYELEHDTDPSEPTNDAITCVRYGCGARVAGNEPVEPLAAWMSVGALAALGLLRARSRRRG